MISRFNPPVHRPRVVRVRGSSGSTEGKVTVSQKECAYVGFTSFERWPSKSSPIYHYAACLLKSIIKKHTGCDVEAHGQYMGALMGVTYRSDWAAGGTSYAVVTPTPVAKIEFISKNQRNEIASPSVFTEKKFDVTINLNWTFHETASEIAVGLLNNFAARPIGNLAYHSGDNAADPELYGYHVVSLMDANETTKDGNTRGTYFRHPLVRLDNQKVSIKCDTFIRVQNMTTGTNGTDMSLLGQNPLTMRIYHFKDPYPSIRKINLYNRQVPTNADGHTGDAFGYLYPIGGNAAHVLMCDVNGDGVINIGPQSAGLPGWERLPSADMFTNLAGVGRDKMNPDEIKYHRMKFRFYGYINKFFEGYMGGNFQTETNETDAKPAVMLLPKESANLLGTHDLFGFQHYMPDPTADGTATSIDLHALVKRYTHVTLGKRVHRNMLPYRQEAWGLVGRTIEGVVVPAGYEPDPNRTVVVDNDTADNNMILDAMRA